MKTILVPLDYSDDSINAMNYAVSLADSLKAEIILFHVFEVPVTVTDMPVVLMTPEELEIINNEKMTEIADRIKSKTNIEIKVQSSPGFAVDEIAGKIKTINADLTVMGIRSVSHLTELFIGSYSTDVTKIANRPLLIVPEKAVFRKIDKILFLTDNTEIAGNPSVILLKELALLFNAELSFLHIITRKEHSESTPTADFIDFSETMTGIKFSAHIIQAEDVLEGVHQFMNNFPADLIVTIPHKHSFFERLKNESNTKKLAFHTPIPMLSLPDIKI